MTTVVATQIVELVKSFGDAVVDYQLAAELGEKARRREIVGGNAALMLSDEELVGSKLLKILYDQRKKLVFSSGTAHVIYAPSSTGKTSALMYFMKDQLEKYGAPAIMVSGQFPGNLDYLTCMATALGIPLKGKESYDVSWIKSLISGLLPREAETLEHAPVLILDEFNSPGINRENILFAESLARYVYGKKITLVIATQNIHVASDICLCNAWHKVGPFPGMTTPDRLSKPLPPASYEWINVKWSQHKLKQMIQKRPKFKGKFDAAEEFDGDGNFIWLRNIEDTVAAIMAADERLAQLIPEKEGGRQFEHEFWD